MRNISRIGSVLLLAGAVSCDTKVSNPGPVNDVFLNDRSAALAMVNGAGRALAQGINWISYTGAAVSREIHPAGSTGSFGITQRWQNGDLTTEDSEISYALGTGPARTLARRRDAATYGGRGTATGVGTGRRPHGVPEPAAGRVSLRRLR